MFAPMAGDDFLFLGAHRALDFVNTWTVDRGKEVERLGDFGALVAWARAANLLKPAETDAAFARWPTHGDAAHVRREALALREAFRGWLRDPATVETLLARVNAALASAVPREEIALQDRRLFRRYALDGAGPDALLRPLALDVVDVLCAVPRGQVRRCEAPDCEAWFRAFDRTSARTWCSVERCAQRRRTALWRAANGRRSP